MSNPQQFYMLRVKGTESFLTTVGGAPYINVDWGDVQLRNVAEHHGVAVEELEVVPVELGAMDKR